MAHFHFHMRSKHYTLLDENGKVLDGTWEAYIHALALIQKCQYDLCLRDDRDQWSIEICDDFGVAELIIPVPNQSR